MDEDGFPTRLKCKKKDVPASSQEEQPTSRPKSTEKGKASLGQDRASTLRAAAMEHPPLPSKKGALKAIAKEHMPAAKKERTRQIDGSWGKVRVGGGATKAYIPYQETDTKK